MAINPQFIFDNACIHKGKLVFVYTENQQTYVVEKVGGY